MKRRFNRFELKYVIRADLRDALIVDLEKNMTLDAHGDSDGLYRVTSLYYDSPDGACYRSKVDGIKYRRKVRARIYGNYLDDETQPVALEIKQRINRTVQKRRIRVPFADASALIRGHKSLELDDDDDRAVASEVDFMARALRLQPACVISYLRQAWVGSRYETGLRITFDHKLSCRGPERELRSGIPDHLFMPNEWIILEVKADDAVPLWVSRMLTRNQCQLTRISKYCKGMVKLSTLERSAEAQA